MFVNRWAILVKARQPYIDWANSLDDDGPTTTLEEARSNSTIYLVHEHEGASLHELIDEWYWEALFDLELVSWMRDTSTWPDDRSADMFYEWFEVELFTEVVNLVKGRIKSS